MSGDGLCSALDANRKSNSKYLGPMGLKDTEVSIAYIVESIWREHDNDIDAIQEIIQRWARSLHAASPTTASHHEDWGVQSGVQKAQERINPPTAPSAN